MAVRWQQRDGQCEVAHVSERLDHDEVEAGAGRVLPDPRVLPGDEGDRPGTGDVCCDNGPHSEFV